MWPSLQFGFNHMLSKTNLLISNYNLSIDNWVPHSIVECYYTCIIEILGYFFILQSLTTSKMRKFQTLKLPQFHKAKTCWTENWWSSGIMSNFWGEFFYVLVGKKFLNFFFKFFAPQNLKKNSPQKLLVIPLDH